MTTVRFRFPAREERSADAPVTSRARPGAARIGDGRLWLGSVTSARSREFVKGAGVGLVVLVANEDQAETPDFYQEDGIFSLRVPASTWDDRHLLQEVMEFGEVFQHIADALRARCAVLVASPNRGTQGAAALCAGMLMRDSPVAYPTLDSAVEAVRAAIPDAMLPYATFAEALRGYAAFLGCAQCADHVPARCSTVSGATSLRPPGASRAPRGGHPGVRSA